MFIQLEDLYLYYTILCVAKCAGATEVTIDIGRAGELLNLLSDSKQVYMYNDDEIKVVDSGGRGNGGGESDVSVCSPSKQRHSTQIRTDAVRA